MYTSFMFFHDADAFDLKNETFRKKEEKIVRIDRSKYKKPYRRPAPSKNIFGFFSRWPVIPMNFTHRTPQSLASLLEDFSEHRLAHFLSDNRLTNSNDYEKSEIFSKAFSILSSLKEEMVSPSHIRAAQYLTPRILESHFSSTVEHSLEVMPLVLFRAVTPLLPPRTIQKMFRYSSNRWVHSSNPSDQIVEKILFLVKNSLIPEKVYKSNKSQFLENVFAIKSNSNSWDMLFNLSMKKCSWNDASLRMLTVKHQSDEFIDSFIVAPDPALIDLKKILEYARFHGFFLPASEARLSRLEIEEKLGLMPNSESIKSSRKI